MKQFLITCILVAAAHTAAAMSLVVTLADGTEVYYRLQSGSWPVMTVNDEQVTVNTDSYAFSSFQNFRISSSDAPTAVSAVRIKDIGHDGSELYVNSGGRQVGIYTVDGRKTNAKTTDRGTMTVVSTRGLSKGTYVVRIGDTSFKFLKK